MEREKYEFTWKQAYIVLGVLFLCLLVRTFWGIESTDETFYFALAKRFWQGDRLMNDEWFPAQMIGILLLPFFKLYVIIKGSAEGVILCARLCYVIFSVLISAYLIYVFRKDGSEVKFALFSALFFAIYVRAGIANFSYYSLGLLTFLLTILFMIDGKNTEKLWIRWVLSGASFSISVLCMPYMVVAFGCVVLAYFLYRKNLHIEKEGYFFLLGIVGVAAGFLAFYGCDILSGIRNIPYLFMDPLHQGSIWEKTGGTLRYIVFTYLKYTWPLYMVTLTSALVFRFGHVQAGKSISVFRWILYVEFFVQAIYSRTFFEGGIVCAFFLLALQIQLMNCCFREKEFERYFLWPGIIFGFIWINGSDLGMRVFNMGFCIANVWSLKVIERDIQMTGKTMHCIKELAVFLVLIVLFLNRFLDVYRDSVIWKMDTRVSCGGMKGIYTTSERAAEYEAVIKDLENYTSEEDRLAVPGLNPWIYLEAPARCGVFSVWRVDFKDERNWDYYEEYAGNTPTVIYLLHTDRKTYYGWRWGSHGSSSQGQGVEEAEGYLQELLATGQYEMQKTSTGVFYRLVE